MFKISVLVVFVAAAFAQPGRIVMSGSATLSSGVMVRYKSMLVSTAVSPYNMGLGLGEGGAGGRRNEFHRVMVDGRSGSYFGYDLEIGAGDETNGYVVTFKPPSQESTLLPRLARGRSLKPAPLPAYPPPMVVHNGETIALDLMVSPDGKQKLTDYIEILAHQPIPPPATTTAEPQDFTLDDGPVVFDIEAITIMVQGQKYTGNHGFTGKRGSTFWIAFPGAGRYVLSLAAHEGFAKAGAIRDNVISFADGGRDYEVRFLSPIAGGGKAWNLYMRHDSNWEPKPNQQNMVNMGTDRLENLLPK